MLENARTTDLSELMRPIDKERFLDAIDGLVAMKTAKKLVKESSK